MSSDIAFLDATAQAELVRTKQVSPAELVDGAIARIEQLNPQLNAVIHELFDRARGEAAAALARRALPRRPVLAEGPRGGVGRHAVLRRVVLRRRLPLDRDPGADAPLHGGRLRDLRQDQHARARAFCRPPSRGVSARRATRGTPIIPPAARRAVRPPPWPRAWCRRRTPTTAAGPSAFPRRAAAWSASSRRAGRNSLAPQYGDLMGGLVCEHVVTRSVRDSAAILDATAGPVPGDPYWAPPRRGPSFAAAAATPPPSLRVAVLTSSPTGSAVHPDCVVAAEAAARLCEALGPPGRGGRSPRGR